MTGSLRTLSVSGKAWWRQAAVLALVGLCISAVSVFLALGEVRLVLAVVLIFVLIALATVRIQAAIMAGVVVLVLMGDLRRALITVSDWSETDPLLLIGPALALALVAHAGAVQALRIDTPLARWTLALMAVMTLQVFNPAQGGLIVGVTGIMFLMIPLFWFWVGRAFATPRFMEGLLFRIVLPLGLLVAAVGYYQSFNGYLPYQMTWYETAGYQALGTPEQGLAPISFFASATEHGSFLVIALVLAWASGLMKHRAALVLVPLLLVAILLTGSRGPVAKGLVVAAGLWAVMGQTKKAWIGRGLVALLIAGAGLVWGLQQSNELDLDPRLQNKLDRQAQEFVEQPMAKEGEYSSSVNHFQMMIEGYLVAFEKPLGYGLGATTRAAGKFGGGPSHNTETDIGNAFQALGLVGGGIYQVVMILVIVLAFRYWQRTRGLLALALMGVLGATFFMWLGGGQYAVCPLVWLCIGALDRFERDERLRQETAAEHFEGDGLPATLSVYETEGGRA